MTMSATLQQLDEFTANHLEDWVYLRSGSLNPAQLHQDMLFFISDPDETWIDRSWSQVRSYASIH